MMGRLLTGLTVIVVMLAWVVAPAWAQEEKEPDNTIAEPAPTSEVEIRLSELKRPQDFAPSERIVSGRDPMSFRREGTLLAKTTRVIPKVDEDELVKRKLAMYGGQRFYRGASRISDREGIECGAASHRRVSGAVKPPGGILGWFGWTLTAIIVVVVLVGWRKQWFVPFSVRTQQKHASRAVSRRPRSRAAKGPRIKLIRRR